MKAAVRKITAYGIFVCMLSLAALLVFSDKKDFPEQVSKVMKTAPDHGGNWFVDFKAGNVKYIVFRDKILKYQIGDQAGKDLVCEECRKMGISDGEMNWPE